MTTSQGTRGCYRYTVQRIGFQIEGLQYDSLTEDQRLLQVQRIRLKRTGSDRIWICNVDKKPWNCRKTQ